MTTRFYSPVFNTALFDGPLRVYFSQSHEPSALKIYHLLQTQYVEQWNQLKECSFKSKEHIFLLMYPDKSALDMVFFEKTGSSLSSVQSQEWEEGLAIGFYEPKDDLELVNQLDVITKLIMIWVDKVKLHEISV